VGPLGCFLLRTYDCASIAEFFNIAVALLRTPIGSAPSLEDEAEHGVFRRLAFASARSGKEAIVVLCIRLLTTAVLVAGLGIAPAVHAQHWHGGGNNYHHGGGNYHHGGGGNAAGAAIIGGIIGLGVGAAIASKGYYAAPPPPVYYGAPPAYYYAPPPPVYYGY
jgi:hypothetical protein